jgi:hypothetical protein
LAEKGFLVSPDDHWYEQGGRRDRGKHHWSLVARNPDGEECLVHGRVTTRECRAGFRLVMQGPSMYEVVLPDQVDELKPSTSEGSRYGGSGGSTKPTAR